METISFGRTGLKVSKLCFGTMTIGSSQWKPWVLDEADAQPLLKRYNHSLNDVLISASHSSTRRTGTQPVKASALWQRR